MAKQVQEPEYEVIQSEGAFEVRRYAPYTIARTETGSDYRQSLYTGFRRLADFIFGKNAQQQAIAMTAPVGHMATDTGYAVTFAMPAGRTVETLPAPNDTRIQFIDRPERVVAVLRFSGWARQGVAGKKTSDLQQELKARGLRAAGPVELAQYDPPWTLPFLRRNEVQIPLEVD